MGRFGDFRQERDASGWASFCFYKTCRGNLPRLAFYGMRSQHKFVITAGLICHLFVAAPLVTSQALTSPGVQNPAMPVEQSTPTATPTPAPPAPAEPEQNAAATKPPIGNCHSVITSPPATPQAAAQSAGTASTTT